MASHVEDGLLTVSDFMDTQVSGIRTRQAYVHIYVHSIQVHNFSQCCVRLIGRALHSIVSQRGSRSRSRSRSRRRDSGNASQQLRTSASHSFVAKKMQLGTSSASIVPDRRNAHERSCNLARCTVCIRVRTYIHTYIHTYIRTYVQGGRPSTNPVVSSQAPSVVKR